MDAGRELDALVAERVMGDTPDEHGGWVSSDGNTRYNGDGGPMEYSTDIAAAWRVVEKLYALGESVSIDLSQGWRAKYQCCVLDKANVDSDISAEHAICLAALRVVGVDV